MRAFFASARANARARTRSRHLRTLRHKFARTSVIASLSHRTATRLKLCDYLPPTIRHTLASRFRDTTAPTMTAWKGGNIQSHAAAQITSDRACGGRTGGLPVGGLRPRVHRAALRSYCRPDRRIRPIVLSPAASAQTRGRSAELEAGRPRA